MNHINSLIIEGTVAKSELVEVNGTFIIRFSIATSRFKKDEEGNFVEDVSFFECEFFGILAKDIFKNFLEGRGIRVVGRLKENRWNDGDKTCSRLVIIAEHIEFKPIVKKAEPEPNSIAS